MDRTSRPFSVTITALGGFILGMWNMWRTIILIQHSPLLLELGVTLDPRIRLVVALFWGLFFISLAAALWQRRPIVRRLLPFSLLLYALYHLLLLPIFIPSPAARQAVWRDLLFYAIVLLWTGWALNRDAIGHYWQNSRHLLVL